MVNTYGEYVPLSRVVPLPNGLFMAYKWGWSWLLTSPGMILQVPIDSYHIGKLSNSLLSLKAHWVDFVGLLKCFTMFHPFNGLRVWMGLVWLGGWTNVCFAFKISSARQHFWGNDEPKMKESGWLVTCGSFSGIFVADSIPWDAWVSPGNSGKRRFWLGSPYSIHPGIN